MLKTVLIDIGPLANSDGTPALNATGQCTLTHAEIDDGLVVPKSVPITKNGDRYEANLWPTERGALGSRYRMVMYSDTGAKIFDAFLSIPDVDGPLALESVISLETYPPDNPATVTFFELRAVVAESQTNRVVASKHAATAAEAVTTTLANKNSATNAAQNAGTAASNAASASVDASGAAVRAEVAAESAAASANQFAENFMDIAASLTRTQTMLIEQQN